MRKSTRELLDAARKNCVRLEDTAEQIRNRSDIDRPAVRAMYESDLLLTVEFLQEVESYLRQHLPTAKLIAFPSRQEA